jgi:4-coumarate--CoA ligase
MPIESAFPPVTVPAVDLWNFMFERTDREFPEDHGKLYPPQYSLEGDEEFFKILIKHLVVYVDTTVEKQVKFRDVRQAAEQFGRGIRQHWKWQKGDVMALFTPNSADVAAVTFGILWAGGIVCPFNNLYTVGELVSQLKSSGAKALATHASCLAVVREAALIVGLPLDRIVLLGDSPPNSRFQHFSNLQSTTTASERVAINPKEDLAFLVFSSGTTGLPKGVMLTHENMVANIVQSHVVDADMTSWKNDRGIGFLPMYHIYGESGFLMEVFCARSVLMTQSRHLRLDPCSTLPRSQDIHNAAI